jgi:hypothetical protein
MIAEPEGVEPGLFEQGRSADGGSEILPLAVGADAERGFQAGPPFRSDYLL